ncbi:MAG TPA: ferrochelatase [Candidatus Krumholzibacteria bacterium]|nr:ferrochelatase [Candidatus Krumholzibacteria bacterium]
MHDPIGVLLTNLGTPDAPTAPAVRRYLREFLSDRRVVDLPRPLWLPILYGFVLTLRPRRSARAYASIWTNEGSPLLSIMQDLAAAFESALHLQTTVPVHVAVGMTYGNPSMAQGLERLRDAGCLRVLVLPLYPQYSSPTTGSAFDAVARALTSWRRVPELRTISDYHDHRLYLQALGRSVREFWGQHGEPDRLLVSFHGMPQRFDAAGDPYRGQCEATASSLTGLLGLDAQRTLLAFQSRFGREEWLQPYTDVTLQEWARQGISTVDVVCPGFAVDCLETLEEIAIRYRQAFLAAGGQRLRYIPALNDRPDHVTALVDLAIAKLQGWL